MPKQATVQEASPSPPPLPNEPLPEASGSGSAVEPPLPTGDVPINSLGDDDEEASDGAQNEGEGSDDGSEWDPAEERLPGQTSKSKGKEKAVEGEGDQGQPWQAVWAAEQNAWYFWNSITGEVTWTNPLNPNPDPPLPSEPAPAPPLPSEPPPLPEGNFGQIPDIDPDLAYLLPATQRTGAADGQGQSASFNARTGKFQPTDNNYAISHLEEWNRAKRMAGKYFDVDAWEQGLREENAKRKREAEMGGGQEEKKITKKDMERFKKKKAEQKYRKQAWLRD